MAGIFDDPEEEDGGNLGALGGDQLSAYADTLAARDRDEGKAIDEAYAPLRRRYEEAATRLREQRLGPTSAEQLFALGSALSKPMRYKGVGAVVSNIAPVLQEQAQTKRETESSRTAALAELEGKQYDITSQAGLAKIKGRTTRQAALDKLMFTQPKMGFNPVTGEAIFTTGPNQGRRVPGAAKATPEDDTVVINGSTFRKDLKGNLVLVPRSHEEEVGLAAAKKRAETAITDAAEAQKLLPKALETAALALTGIDELRNDPNLSAVTGIPNLLKGDFGVAAVRGSPAAGVRARIEQLKGGAFLQAFEALKGGGQITEVEGIKATDAMARMDTAQSDADFIKALDDYKAVIKMGLARAQRQAALLSQRAARTGGGADPAAFARNKPGERPPLASFMKD